MTDENETELTAEVDVDDSEKLEEMKDLVEEVRDEVEDRAEHGRRWHDIMWKESYITKEQVESFMEEDLEDSMFLARMALAANAIKELAEKCEELGIDNDRLSDEDVQNWDVDDETITLLSGMMIVNSPITEYGQALGVEMDDESSIRF